MGGIFTIHCPWPDGQQEPMYKVLIARPWPGSVAPLCFPFGFVFCRRPHAASGILQDFILSRRFNILTYPLLVGSRPGQPGFGLISYNPLSLSRVPQGIHHGVLQFSSSVVGEYRTSPRFTELSSSHVSQQ